MRHKVDGRKFDRPTGHRMAMYRNLVRSLIEHERIVTTEAKAKESRRFAERMITLGREGTLQARRQALKFITEESVVKKVFDELGPHYKTRPGGYTRIIKLGPRTGDNAPMALLELVDRVVHERPVVPARGRNDVG
ncbi:MAG: 50S ribosomal protein L17 [Dehalococcoidia bacterium]|nr:50S ribosomal protein L17 [Dehalococcoidia bacterium]